MFITYIHIPPYHCPLEWSPKIFPTRPLSNVEKWQKFLAEIFKCLRIKLLSKKKAKKNRNQFSRLQTWFQQLKHLIQTLIKDT